MAVATKSAEYYRELSLSYQPCNRGVVRWKGSVDLTSYPKTPKAKKSRRKNRRVRGPITEPAPPPEKLAFARGLYERRTKAEKLLSIVLSETLPRYKLTFREQFVIGEYIVDFLVPERRLIIEVDGEYHFFNGKRDGFRTKTLKKRGYRLIRFTNHEVETDIAGVYKQILEKCVGSHAVLALE